jgi:two-component system, OmpR family, sensor kinase
VSRADDTWVAGRVTGRYRGVDRLARPWRPHTLRARLTVVVIVGATVLLVVALSILYAVLSAQLHAAVDDGLRARLEDIAATAHAGQARPIADPYAQLLDASGDVVAASVTAPDTSVLTPAQLGAARHDLVLLNRSAAGLPGPARLAAVAVPGTDRVAVAGTSLAGVEATNDRLLVTLAVALPVLILLLALVLRGAVKASLRPVAALSTQANRISTAGSSDRLPQPPGDDEIADLARTLNAMLDRLSVSFERERAFVDDASHELRTPIAVLRGELELALLDNDPAQMRRAVEIAQSEAEHLSNLAVDLLVLARQRAGTLVLQPGSADLYAVAEQTLSRLRPLLGVHLRACGEPLHADVDVVRVDQLLTNLVTNAAEAGAKHVQVRISRTGANAVLEVEDDGPGFPEDLLTSAFDRFTRADHARTRRSNGRPATTGAGLGLAIAAAIAHAHGGHINVANDASLGGARLRIELPVAASR